MVGERGDVQSGALDAQDAFYFIIHFQGVRPKGVLEPGALHQGLEPGVGQSPAVGARLFAHEAEDVLTPHFHYRRACDFQEEIGQDAPAFEEHVGAPFRLVDNPVQARAEALVDAHPMGCGFFEHAMQAPGIEVFDQTLRRSQVANPGKAVVGLFIGQASPHHLPLQPLVAVAVELQAEGSPGGDAQVTEAKFGVDKVDVEVLTAPRIPLQFQPVALAHGSDPEAAAALHRPKHADNPRMIPPRCDDLRHHILLALAPLHLAHFDSRRLGLRAYPFGDFQAPAIGMVLNKILKTDARPMKILPQGCRPPYRPIGPTQNHPIKTFKHPLDVLRMPLHQCLSFHPKSYSHQ